MKIITKKRQHTHKSTHLLVWQCA